MNKITAYATGLIATGLIFTASDIVGGYVGGRYAPHIMPKNMACFYTKVSSQPAGLHVVDEILYSQRKGFADFHDANCK
ncbi:MAG TPA: hypothetical protein VJI12_02125 [archaeon]|nr:hypothetical protein [archaeon]